MNCCKQIFWACSVIVAIGAIFAGMLYYNFNNFEYNEEIAYHLGEEGVQIFKAFDRNEDNYLSLEEFESLYHSIIKRDEDINQVRKLQIYTVLTFTQYIICCYASDICLQSDCLV